VTQVQLAKKKGNRWLYKLPCDYFDWCLDRLHRAFVGTPLWLVTGESMTHHIARSYEFAQMVPPSVEALLRVRRLYNRPLGQYTRTSEKYERNRRVFYRLAKKRAANVQKEENPQTQEVSA